MSKPNFYNIIDIKENIDLVKLPAIQRGFVWKPAQMAYLWDSLLRGYPIGSFLVSNNENSKELLDGQQRMTSIVSGFYNPFDEENNSILSLSEVPVLWIDLSPRVKPKDSEYSIFVCTRSHPWGYSASNPSERLRASKIKKFLDIRKVENDNYYNIKPRDYYPIDATYPIPLSFLLNNSSCSSNSSDSLMQMIKDRLDYNIHDDITITDSELQLYLKAANLAKTVYIPELLIDLLAVKLTEGSFQEEDSRDPTLFERLNQNGTRIDGDELIYSYYKSVFPKAKELIESIGQGYLPPKILLNIFSRFAFQMISEEDKGYRKGFTLDGFKNAIRNNKEYKDSLYKLLPTHSSSQIHNRSASDRFEILVSLFTNYGRGSSIVIPRTIIRYLMKDSDLVYIFLCFIEKINIKDSSEEGKNQIVSLFIYIHLFSIKEKKVYKKLFNDLVVGYNGEDLSFFVKKIFAIIQYDGEDRDKANNWEEHVFRLVPFEVIRQEIITNKVSTEDVTSFNRMCQSSHFRKAFYKGENQNEIYKFFIERLQRKREILILAQYDYISKSFKAFDQIDIVEDTNRPWDYDHICPKSWAYSRGGEGKAKKHIHWLVKDWINTNGNYRALSFSENRRDGNRVPLACRLNSEEVMQSSLITKEEYEKYWKSLDKIHFIKDSNDENLSVFLNAIVRRTERIYNKLYEDFFKHLV